MLRAMRARPPLDVRELIVQRVNMDAAHDREQRPRPEQIEANYAIDDKLRNSLTAGYRPVRRRADNRRAFRAASNVLQRAFPEARIIGVFIARRVPEAADIEEFEL
jgi:hypothetical protein